MPLMRVVDRDGVEHEVEARAGLKVMENLRELDYGVAAICGGMCSCATCHVYVDPAWVDRVPEPMSDERELLSELSHTQENSRLSCQIEFTPELAGLGSSSLRTSRRAMSTATVDVETRGAVAIVTLNRPAQSNTLSLQMGMDLLAAAMTCARSTAVRAVVLTGAGQNFCFGGDLRGMTNKGGAEAYLRELTSYLHAAISLFVRMDPPVIAAVRGTAAAAGIGLMAMADLAVASESSRFNLAYTGVGLTPDAGTSFLLPRAVGARRAMELLLLNRSLSAQEALSWGLVNRVVPDAMVVDEALALAEKLAAGPTRAFGKVKRLVAQSLGALESQMVLESETIAGQAASAEGAEGISAFLAKRKPAFP
jgi:2-(1,2-epoxy-1,2-dihydrophenyl)acetyl-CoA isomerase